MNKVDYLTNSRGVVTVPKGKHNTYCISSGSSFFKDTCVKLFESKIEHVVAIPLRTIEGQEVEITGTKKTKKLRIGSRVPFSAFNLVLDFDKSYLDAYPRYHLLQDNYEGKKVMKSLAFKITGAPDSTIDTVAMRIQLYAADGPAHEREFF